MFSLLLLFQNVESYKPWTFQLTEAERARVMESSLSWSKVPLFTSSATCSSASLFLLGLLLVN